ncbi:hypothetical protein QJ856_gp0228 [Tupanvirus deep ocean]|uniref:Uncharacterized protein n=2 Tax=Tupanvirus TaxID=2094720 RepID=A0AC62A9Z7_9VIRU|nr:hypothetical protein QJ856_gp0228 [Tupanvirus deep ocean]QKU34503.1 hypothetical protein [Tupanvirus deep ocean]
MNTIAGTTTENSMLNNNINDDKMMFDALNKQYIEYMSQRQQHMQMPQQVDPYYFLFTGSPLAAQMNNYNTTNINPSLLGQTQACIKPIEQSNPTNNNNKSETKQPRLPTTVIESSTSIKSKQLQIDYEKKLLERKQLDLEIAKQNQSFPDNFKFGEQSNPSKIEGVELNTECKYANFDQIESFKSFKPFEFKPLEDKPDNHQFKIVDTVNFNSKEDSEYNKHSPKNEWNDLTIDNINTSLKVVTDLKIGYKLKVIDKSFLAPDDSYVYAWRSYWNGASRDVIISFLEHLFEQTNSQMSKLISDIKSNTKNNYKNIGILNDLVHNLSTFLHGFNKIKDVYKSDASCCARLDNIYKKYVNMHTIIICEMTSKNEVYF